MRLTLNVNLSFKFASPTTRRIYNFLANPKNEPVGSRLLRHFDAAKAPSPRRLIMFDYETF
jgi:hypothetical protein